MGWHAYLHHQRRSAVRSRVPPDRHERTERWTTPLQRTTDSCIIGNGPCISVNWRSGDPGVNVQPPPGVRLPRLSVSDRRPASLGTPQTPVASPNATSSASDIADTDSPDEFTTLQHPNHDHQSLPRKLATQEWVLGLPTDIGTSIKDNS